MSGKKSSKSGRKVTTYLRHDELEAFEGLVSIAREVGRSQSWVVDMAIRLAEEKIRDQLLAEKRALRGGHEGTS